MRPADVVKTVARTARPEYLAAFEAGDALFVKYQVNTPLRLGHFIAQTLAETGGLTVTRENMNYSAARLLVIFGVDRSSARITPDEAAIPAIVRAST
jgi:putative chitinase